MPDVLAIGLGIDAKCVGIGNGGMAGPMDHGASRAPGWLPPGSENAVVFAFVDKDVPPNIGGLSPEAAMEAIPVNDG
jgi:hypothetical protein